MKKILLPLLAFGIVAVTCAEPAKQDAAGKASASAEPWRLQQALAQTF